MELATGQIHGLVQTQISKRNSRYLKITISMMQITLQMANGLQQQMKMDIEGLECKHWSE